ncbi:hypothetical protein [Pseudomonas sp.]|uniref:hypothetical protein n=1 Tax=Pseudomonas sp. TaxID=306 RepID=UPI00257E8384|nr:hypothetical protein [Pseudomonas sp.]
MTVLIGDRVVCDLCLCVLGQLFNQPVNHSDLLHDQSLSPMYTVCPDCLDAAEVEPAVLERGE